MEDLNDENTSVAHLTATLETISVSEDKKSSDEYETRYEAETNGKDSVTINPLDVALSSSGTAETLFSACYNNNYSVQHTNLSSLNEIFI